MAEESIKFTLQPKLNVMIFELNGVTKFYVHAVIDGDTKLVDVTDQYEVTATTIPATGQSGFVVLKK